MTSNDDFEAVVIGLGVLGASALRELARDGVRVLGVERFALGHANGSSHGRSRAVRFLYHAPEYVRLLGPAIDGWRGLERESGRRLYWNCGTLFFARPGNALLEQNAAIMADAGLPHERLDESAARRRFPAFAMTHGAEAIFNEDGGMVDADAAVAAFLDGARRAGAHISENTGVSRINFDGARVRITTERGDVTARHVVIAAGAWTNDLLPDLGLPIRVTRQAWFTMRPREQRPVDPTQVPVWCDYDRLYYGFPDHGAGLKIADDTPGREVDPDAIDPQLDDPSESGRLTAYIRERFPSSDLLFEEAGTCLYALTPDEDFVLGSVPGSGGRASVIVGLNHAFKFAPVIGRILADLATSGRTAHPIERFRIDRFSVAAAT